MGADEHSELIECVAMTSYPIMPALSALSASIRVKTLHIRPFRVNPRQNPSPPYNPSIPVIAQGCQHAIRQRRGIGLLRMQMQFRALRGLVG